MTGFCFFFLFFASTNVLAHTALNHVLKIVSANYYTSACCKNSQVYKGEPAHALDSCTSKGRERISLAGANRGNVKRTAIGIVAFLLTTVLLNISFSSIATTTKPFLKIYAAAHSLDGALRPPVHNTFWRDPAKDPFTKCTIKVPWSGTHLWSGSKYKDTLNYVRGVHFSSGIFSAEKCVYKERKFHKNVEVSLSESLSCPNRGGSHHLWNPRVHVSFSSIQKHTATYKQNL